MCNALSLANLMLCHRSISDFEFSLGPFSLMEEILTGQEWAKFLNPALPAFSTNQRSSEQPSSNPESTLSPQGQNGAQSPVIPNQPAGVNNHWSFRGSESTQVSGFSMAPDTEISADVSMPARMDISEPMEHSQTQADMESEESGKGVEHKAQEAVTFTKVRYQEATNWPLQRTFLHQNDHFYRPS